MSLRNIDLNLVPMLRVLLREKSLSKTADILALSQPAVSAALKRMREAFADPLLIRVGGKWELTPRTVELIGLLEQLCSDLEHIFAVPDFNPMTSQRTFVVAAPDVISFLLLPHFLELLQREAPRTTLRVVDVSERLIEQMSSREVDVAILPAFFLEDLPSGPLRFRAIFRDKSLAVFRRGHPLSRAETLTQAVLSKFRMIAFHPGSDVIERKRKSVMIGTNEFNVAALVPQTLLPAFLVLKTDYFAILPGLMAQQLAKTLPIEARPLAFATGDFEVGLAWSQLQDADSAHRWFRERAEDVARLTFGRGGRQNRPRNSPPGAAVR